MDNRKEMGIRLASVRMQQGYTQERLAEALNTDRTHISKIEAGTRSCSAELWMEMAILLDVSLDYLMLGKKDMRNSRDLSAELGGIIGQLITFQEKL